MDFLVGLLAVNVTSEILRLIYLKKSIFELRKAIGDIR